MGFVDKIIDIYIKSLCIYVYVLHSRELDMTAMEERSRHGLEMQSALQREP